MNAPLSSVTMPSPSQRKRDRRSVRDQSRAVYRQAIIEAAIRIFGRTGFRDTKITDIAAEAGVATGTLYNYFSSKEDIFSSILDDGRERLATLLAEPLRLADPIARLHEVVRVMFAFLEEHGALFTIYLQVGGSPIEFRRDENACDEEIRQFILSTFTTALTEAGDRMRTDYPPQILAMGLGGLINGAIVDWVDRGCQPGLRAQADTIMDLFLHGATPR